MKTHIENKSVRNVIGNALAGIFVLCFFAFAISGQAPPNPVPAQENIPSGALIIPMDNVNQGNAGGTTFNPRAYGLANLFLQNNIPVKWAIKPAKSKDDVDFSANVTRIAGAEGVAGPANVSFSGGPFIIPQEFDTPSLRSLITTFNGGGTAVTVYKTNANAMVDIRYTLTHKPKIAIGPDGGNFGTSVHQTLFNTAGISNYTIVDNSIINASSCFTLATQAHSTDSQFVNLYKQFTLSGGNLLLQCASVNTYENNANGHFQTTNPGYSVFGTNDNTAVDTTLIYPEGAMPFNQFIGILANQDGAITEYAYAAGGGAANGNRIAARNSGGEASKFVGTVSQLNGNAAGGTVFELGGHDYSRNNTGASEIAKLNGQRMILNAVFVPVNRPTECGLQQANVSGYKSVRRVIPAGPGGSIQPGNTVEWTIDYINNSPLDIPNFQIRDVIQANLTFVAGSNLVTFVSADGFSMASRNTLYDGIGNDSTSDLLAAGAQLKVNGRIQVKVRMTVNANTPNGTVLRNQTVATGSNLTPSTSLNSDNVDATNIDIAGPGSTPPPNSVPQSQNPASNDPTTFPVFFVPTAADASIEGSVRDVNGMGIGKALVTATNAATGVSSSVRTNTFGEYRIDGLQAGELYLVTVQHKRYVFPNGSVTFTLNDSVTGLAFIGNLPGGREVVLSPVKQKK